MAPEEALDPRRADIRADIYSLGCTLYRFLSGCVPFPDGTPLHKVRCHLKRMPEPLPQLRPDIPKELAGIVERMMAKDAAHRPQTPQEVAQALAPFTGSRQRRILVVDDDPVMWQAVSVALQAEGYTVSYASHGGEAMQRLRHEPWQWLCKPWTICKNPSPLTNWRCGSNITPARIRSSHPRYALILPAAALADEIGASLHSHLEGLYR